VAFNSWINTSGGTREQITFTVYDTAYEAATLKEYMMQQNLRNRVSYMGTKKRATDTYQYTATFYTYDAHGNVDTLLQDYKGIAEMGSSDRFKRIAYDYDLISGKVNRIEYQPGYADAFYQRYKYDAENRQITAETSRDKIYWERDAAYTYYKHGALARAELGQLRVQGIDYAYTIQGWIKGINSTNTGAGAFDIGKDGLASGNNSNVARDVLGFALHYYDTIENGNNWIDYKAIGGTSAFARPGTVNSVASLYNGNISGISINNAGLAKGPAATTNALPLFYKYRYDQLNRLVSMQAYKGLDAATNQWNAIAINDYAETISYDPNGNIITYNRAGAPAISGKPAVMDSLTYFYPDTTNQLGYVTDKVSSTTSTYTEDVETQSANNYTFDAIGNLKKDVAEGVDNIIWTVYGKIDTLVRKGETITYTYDAAGNRIAKKTAASTTVYVRDATGNVLSVYEKPSTASLQQTEVHLYGISRLGMAAKLTVAPQAVNLTASYGTATMSTFTRNEKVFELSNHLGNVLATIGDKKIQNSSNNTTIDYYTANVLTANDYYPFGMLMPGRKYSAGNAYRYGFNGKENDNEVKGEGNQQDYGMRVYDPRIAKFLSVDPLTQKYPWYTPYQFAGNRPVDAIDLDGMEPKTVNKDHKTIDLPVRGATGVPDNDPVAYGNEIKQWLDLLNYEMPVKVLKDANRSYPWLIGSYQTIQNANSTMTNFDYYVLEITKLPIGIKNAGELLEAIRLHIGDMVDSKTVFEPYSDGSKRVWESSNPVGSILQFNAYFDITVPLIDVKIGTWNLDDASVITSDYYNDPATGGYWTFSTINTLFDGGHPIAGTRQFGVSAIQKADGSTSYLFYIRAVDRSYGFIEGKVQKTVFSSAEETWNTVMQNVSMWTLTNGGMFIPPYKPISKRIPWTEVQKSLQATGKNK
jgi:RHS repeat-associated protein